MNKNDSPLFYTCSLIEFIGRKCHQKRSAIVNLLGEKAIDRIYHNADILHCEVIDAVADRYIEMLSIPAGDFDNVSSCKYTLPDYWTIGAVYERLIEDVEKDDSNPVSCLVSEPSVLVSTTSASTPIEAR